MTDSISFTKEEIEIIKEQLQVKVDKKFSSYFPNKARFLKESRVNKIFNNKNKGWHYFYVKYGKELYSFSNPIFLRNNTICLFYKATLCGGLCGGGSLDLWIKVNNKWEFFDLLYLWMS